MRIGLVLPNNASTLYYGNGGTPGGCYRMVNAPLPQPGAPLPLLAARNPNAAAVLAQAAEIAAKREARLAANPKPPKSAAGQKRKGPSKEETPRAVVTALLSQLGRSSNQVASPGVQLPIVPLLAQLSGAFRSPAPHPDGGQQGQQQAQQQAQIYFDDYEAHS